MGGQLVIDRSKRQAKFHIDGEVKFRIAEAQPNVQSNALLVPKMRVKAQHSFWGSGCSQATRILNMLLQAYVRSPDLTASVSELICPIFDPARIGGFPFRFCGYSFKGI